MSRWIDKLRINIKGKLSSVRGMTMAELMAVVAIIGILAGVSFIAVQNYQRSTGQLERDGIAQEIFVAAQHHLTAVSDMNTTKQSDDSSLGTAEGDGDDIYYYAVNQGSVVSEKGTTDWNLMLPLGSIDETVRLGGSYIVRYQKSTGTVLDVFYWTNNASPTVFNHAYQDGDYATLVNGYRGSGKKSARKNYQENGENSIIGWYGGASAGTSPITAPVITVTNEEKLYVTLNYPTDELSNLTLKLFVTGASSGAQKKIDLTMSDVNYRVSYRDDSDTEKRIYTIILDDITSNQQHHFYELGADSGKFIIGENLYIQAVAYSSEKGSIAYSTELTTNSLFEKLEISDETQDTKIQDTIVVNNIRHLENLGIYVSNLDELSAIAAKTDGVHSEPAISVSRAEQDNNLDWVQFQKNIKLLESEIKGDDTISSEGYESVSVYDLQSTPVCCTMKKDGVTYGCYYPVTPYQYTKLFTYDGQNHTISNVLVSYTGNAGLFGSIGLDYDGSKYEIDNLKLSDFEIAGTDNAGALAGYMNGTALNNVIAVNSVGVTAASSSTTNNDSKGFDPTITATGSAGGLVGTMSGGSLEYCAAALVVGGETESGAATAGTAGGLVGTVTGTTAATISHCYCGGHTNEGSFYITTADDEDSDDNESKTPIYNVLAARTAGGLVGDAGNAAITDCYATSSVSATADKGLAGGFVGTASGNITDSYSAGLVKTAAAADTDSDDDTADTANSTVGAFAGSLTGSAYVSGCSYYSVINEVLQEDGTPDHYLNPVGDKEKDGITAFDKNTDTYNVFVGTSYGTAGAYDSDLVKYYNNGYPLKAITIKTSSVSASSTGDSSSDDETGANTETTTPTVTGLSADTLSNDTQNLLSAFNTETTDTTNYFVKTHYGDWPAPEIFVINEGGTDSSDDSDEETTSADSN